MLTRPRPIIDLDNISESHWKIYDGPLYIYRNSSWTHEQVGCILCAEANRQDPRGQTLRNDNDKTYHCLTHGDLEEVTYSVERITRIRISGHFKEVVQTIKQFVLFPKTLTPVAREIIFVDLLNVIAEAETKNESDSDSESDL